jgi:hypothetical protein
LPSRIEADRDIASPQRHWDLVPVVGRIGSASSGAVVALITLAAERARPAVVTTVVEFGQPGR